MLAEATLDNQSYIRRGRESEQFYFNHLRNAQENQTSAELVGQYVVRGLAATYYRNNTQSSDLRTFVREYLGVQYNAVLNNARGQGNNSNLYGSSWTTPPSPLNFSLQSQTNALSILLAAIPLHNDSDTLSNRPSPTGGGGGSGPRQTRPSIGVVVGAVLGGLAAAGLLAFLVFWLIRRRNRRQKPTLDTIEERPHDSTRNQTVEPFTSMGERNREGAKDGKLPSGRAPRDWERGGDERTSIGLNYATDTDASSSQGPYGSESMIPTADLIRLLNRRLQGVEWRGDEQPPDYASQG
ncbi:hypothetical protein AAF712_000921 [Marasmius tenuissimus]|uniref:receptor protein-tyrosine kinase n=1 Tax=Marasmius tenuissimus TaxID=585030 RepID=A0ABR3AE42_9AGAR